MLVSIQLQLFIIKFMSQPFSESPTPFNRDNPQIITKQTSQKIFDDPSTYKLNQSFFTKQQLFAQNNYGVYEREDSLYFGGIYNAMKHGWGVLITKNTVYEGKFSLNHKMGKGYMKFANDSVYVGDFTNDKPHGHGLLQYNQQYYIGDFENGMMQGDGLWKNSKGQKYVGQWKSNKAHGYGIYITSQSHYQGDFSQFVKHGYGVQKFQNGDNYRGNYQNGKPHGFGQYFWFCGAHYKGQFAQGFRQGQGIWISEHGDKYTGHFSCDRKNGYGEYIWINGNHYKGQFCQDMREGQGQMAWNDGSTYEGQWQRGLPHGKGIFKVKGEKPHAGIFQDNVLVKQLKANQYLPQSLQNSRGKNDSSLILAMIPQMTKRRKAHQSQQKRKSRKHQLSGSTNPTMSFNTTSRNRTWRSRMK